MPAPRPTKAELAQLAEMLENAGLVEVYLNDEGREAYRLTDECARVGHMLATVEGEDADEMLEALLGVRPGYHDGGATLRLVMARERAYDVQVLDDGSEFRLRRRT